MGDSTRSLPKPMLAFGGKPILEHLIERLAAAGWKEIQLCLGYRPEAVTAHFGDGSRWGVKLRYHVEKIPRGTAGSVADVRAEIGEDMLVVYGDLYTDMDFKRFADFHGAHQSSAASIVLIATDHPFDSDLVRLDGGRLTGLYRAQPGAT